MVSTLILLLYFSLLSFIQTLNLSFNISNSPTCQANCSSNLFSLLQQLGLNYPSATISDIFTVNIEPTNNPYYLFQSDISQYSPLISFKGSLILQNMFPDPNYINLPIIKWVTNSLILKINSYLGIFGIIIEGINAHVAPQFLCNSNTLASCCQIANLTEANSVCLLQNKTFQMASGADDGVIILDSSAILEIMGLSLQNFHGLVNYKSFISPGDNSTITINTSNFSQCFFLKGLVSYYAINFGYLVFELTNTSIQDWNKFQAGYKLENVKLFDVLTPVTYILGFRNSLNLLTISQLFLTNILADHVILFGDLNISLTDSSLQTFAGAAILRIFGGASLFLFRSTFSDISSVNPNQAFLYSTKDDSQTSPISFFNLTNITISRTSAMLIYLEFAICFIENALLSNIYFPVYVRDYGLVLYCHTNAQFLASNLTLIDLSGVINSVFYFTSLSLPAVFSNCNFININFLDSYTYLFEYFTLNLTDSVIWNVACSQALFEVPMSWSGNSYLAINSTLFYNLSSQHYGPFIMITHDVSIVSLNHSTFDQVIAGVFFFLGKPFPNVTVYIDNSHFLNFNVLSGILFAHLEGEHLICSRSSFTNITFMESFLFNAVFGIDKASADFKDCMFSGFKFLNGDGDFILSKESKVTLNGVLVSDFYMEGKGGLRSTASNLSIFNSSFSNIFKLEDGFVKVNDAQILLIDGSSFFNFRGFKYAVLSVRNAGTLNISNSVFYNASSDFEAAVFSITSTGDQSVSFWIVNNSFILNQALISYAGTILLSNSQVSMILLNNSFSKGFTSLNGALLFTSDISSLTVINNTFFDSAAGQNGGALSLINSGVEITGSGFKDNKAGANGKGGQIYLENSNLTLSLSWFRNGNTSLGAFQGSCLYASYSNESPYQIIFTDSIIDSFNGFLEVLFISSAANFNTVIQNLTILNSNSIIREGLISITTANLNITGLIIRNCSCYDGNLLDINANNYVQAKTLEISKNYLISSGNLIKISNAASIFLNDLLILNNTFEDAYISFLSFGNILLSSIFVENNTVSTLNTYSQFLLYLDTGNSIILTNVTCFNSNMSLISMANVLNATFENIIGRGLWASNTNFLIISNANLIEIQGIRLDSSSIPGLLFNVIGDLSLLNSEFTSISVQNTSYFLSVSQSNNFSIYSLHLFSLDEGILFDTISKVNITDLILNNPLNLSFPSNPPFLQNTQINNFSMKNSIIINVPGPQTMQFTNSQSNINFVNISNVSIADCYSVFGLSGYFGVSITSSNFSNVTSSHLNFQSSNANSLLLLINDSFQPNGNQDPDFELVIPNDQFYLDFIKNNQALLTPSLLTFSSYTYEIRMLWGEDASLLLPNDSFVSIYSGEAIHIKFEAYNHFGSLTAASNKWPVELRQINTNYELRNYQTIFLGDHAFLSGASVIIPEKDQAKNLTLEMMILIGQPSGTNIKNFSMTLKLGVKRCDKGKTLISDKCVTCDSESYSLLEYPTNADNCSSCPEYAVCVNGSLVTPKSGFWNVDLSSLLIIKCEIDEACEFQFVGTQGDWQQCTEKYTGNVCAQCQIYYGKNLIRQCVECDGNPYLLRHIIRTILKLIILALLALYNLFLVGRAKGEEVEKPIIQLCGILNNFIFHFTVFAIIGYLQTAVSAGFDAFLETQSVFSFFENNVFLIYCIFPKIEGFELALAILMYLAFLILLQFLIAALILKLVKKTIQVQDLLLLGYIIYFHNFYTLLFYFLGLIFPFWISPTVSYSIFFKDVAYGSIEFFVLFGLELGIWMVLRILSIVYKRKVSETPYLLLYEDHNNKKLIYYARNFILFGVVALTNYGFEDELPLFCQKMIYLYIALLITFRIQKDDKLFLFKLFSLIVLIISFSGYEVAIMVLNSFHFVCCIVASFGLYYLDRKKRIIKIK